MRAWTVDADDIRVAEDFDESLLHRTPEIDSFLTPDRDDKFIVIATKAWTGRGTPLRGGLPSGHAAVAFAGWMAATYIVGDTHRFVVSALTFIMAMLVAQTRVESGVHSALEVAYGGALGALVTLSVFQLL